MLFSTHYKNNEHNEEKFILGSYYSGLWNEFAGFGF